MDKIFNLDSPVMQILGKIADLIWLNILTLICCIPVVTAGAAFTALHYVVLKMVRNEEGYITKSFFKSFRDNFRQATIIWLILLVFVIMFVGDVYIFLFTELTFPKVLVGVVLAFAVLVTFVSIYVFPVLSKFDNTVRNTIKNAFMISILSLPKTILMIIIYALPVVILYFSMRVFPIVIMLGYSGTAFLCAMLYNKTFKRFEPEEEPVQDSFFLEEEEEAAEEPVRIEQEKSNQE